jgi:hypothetical protein
MYIIDTSPKTIRSYRFFVNYYVDRLGVEARQRVQLTSTNSSIGLIYELKKILDEILFYLL